LIALIQEASIFIGASRCMVNCFTTKIQAQRCWVRKSALPQFQPLCQKALPDPRVMVHACNPSTQEVEAGGSPVLGQAGLDSKTLSLKEKKKKATKALPSAESNISYHMLGEARAWNDSWN
jgi:hypothetical protein